MQSREQLREVAKRMKERGYSDDEIVNALRSLSQTSETPPVSEPASELATEPVQEPTETPMFKFPFMEESRAAVESGERISPFSMFSSGIEFPALRESIDALPSGVLPYRGLEKPVSKFALSALEGATSPAGAITAIIGGFPQTRSLIKKGLQKIAPGISQRLGLGVAEELGSAVPKAARIKLRTDAEGNIIDEATGAIYRQQPDGSMVNVLTGDIVDPKTGRATGPINQDPNFQGGAGDPELAGSLPYPRNPDKGISFNLNLPERPAVRPPIKVVEPASESLLNPALRSRLHRALDPLQEGAEKLNQQDIDQLTAYVWKNPNLAPEEQTRASIGLLKLLDGEAPLAAELESLSKVMTDDILNLMKTNREAFKRGSLFHEVINLPRSLMSTMDMSAPFRQGLGAINTKAWWTSWGPMLRALGSEKYYHKAMDEILSRPNHIKRIGADGKLIRSFSEEAGLNLSSLTRITSREEAMLSSLAERIPGWGRVVRGSNRAMTLFLNKIRADNFDNLIRQGEGLAQTARETGRARRGLLFSEKFTPEEADLLDPKKNFQLAQNLAGFVNASTGRGSLGALESNAVGLSSVFFSPRLIASRLQYMNPRNYIFTDPMVRKQYVKSLMGIATTWLSVAGLAKGAGAEVSLDPTNSDFGKMKFGNTRLDPAGGFQQYLVLAARIQSGEFTGATSGRTNQLGYGYGTSSRADATEDFWYNKLSPVASYIWGAMRDSDGRPFELGDEAAKRFVPIFAQDLLELIEEDPALFALAPFAGTGMGVQSFGERDAGRILPRITGGLIPEDYEDIRPRDIKFPIPKIRDY